MEPLEPTPSIPYGDRAPRLWAGSTRPGKRTGPKRWEREQVLRLMTYLIDVMDQERAAHDELRELGAAVRQLNAMLIAMAPWADQLIPKRGYPLSKIQALDAVSPT